MDCKPEIWCIDDDDIMFLIIKKLYSKLGFSNSIQCFSNGLNALNHMQSLPNRSDKKIIYLDINMPIMNGWEFLKHLSEDDSKNFYVSILTSSVNREDKTIAARYPIIRNFIEKPLKADQILDLHHHACEVIC